MSQENVEIMRRGVEAFSRADWEESVSLATPDVEWHDAPDLPGARRHKGRDALLARWKDMAETLEDWTVDIEEFFDAGDQVVVFFTSSGRGRISGVEVSRKAAQVATFREGKIIKIVGYADRAKALEAVGLSEQDAHADQP